MTRAFFVALTVLFIFGCTPALGGPSVVVLISLDGTRADEVRELPVFKRIAREGVGPTALRPVFPTNTFPNHVTLVTGVSPDRHGIVNNTFRDPERGAFRYENDPSWLEVEPIWSILAREGVPSAAYHWVGSQGPWRGGLGPRDWHAFDGSVSEKKKVKAIAEWLREPPDTRPRLITSWFRGADGSGHRHGPNSESTQRALRRQDAALAELIEVIDDQNGWSTTTLILVSDHGMAPVRERVDLAAAVEASGARATVRGGGGIAIVNLHRGRNREDRLTQTEEVARKLGLHPYRRGEEGSRELGHPIHHPRFGDLVVLAPLGIGITRATGATGVKARVASKGPLNGSHGYAPEEPSMQGLFAALGRGVDPGAELGPIATLDIAPTLLALLGCRGAFAHGRPRHPTSALSFSRVTLGLRLLSRTAVKRFALLLVLCLLPTPAVAAPATWYAQRISGGDTPFRVEHFWSKGRMVRMETVIRAQPFITFVKGEYYTVVDPGRTQGLGDSAPPLPRPNSTASGPASVPSRPMPIA